MSRGNGGDLVNNESAGRVVYKNHHHSRVSILHPMESISLNSFVLLERLAMLLTSTLAINCSLRNFLNKAIGIINFAKHFPNLIDDTMI